MKSFIVPVALCLHLVHVRSFKSSYLIRSELFQSNKVRFVSNQERTSPDLRVGSVRTGRAREGNHVIKMVSAGNAIKDESNVMTLKFVNLKLSALRSFLKFWMIGQDGWQFDEDLSSGNLILLHRPSLQKKCGISMRLQDAPEDSKLCIVRVGDATLAYALQESLLMHRLLDILDEINKDPEIPKDRRLFSLADEAVLEDARRRLPARPGK
jgi:hypothetical protein